MKALVSAALSLLLMGPSTEEEQDLLKDPCEMEIRAYLLNRDRSPVPVHGISAQLVTRDHSGTEKLSPMTIVWAKSGGEKAPQRWLPIRAVEGTSYVAALCAIHPCGSVLEEPEGPEPIDSSAGERMKIETDVPYFRTEVPTEAVLLPGACSLALRFRILGHYHSTANFPRLTLPKDGAACCSAAMIAAEGLRLERHLEANEPDLAGVDLDRISIRLAINEPKARDESLRQDCLEQSRRVRSTLSSGDRAEAAAAARRLRQLSAKCYPPCGGSPADPPE